MIGKVNEKTPVMVEILFVEEVVQKKKQKPLVQVRMSTNSFLEGLKISKILKLSMTENSCYFDGFLQDFPKFTKIPFKYWLNIW